MDTLIGTQGSTDVRDVIGFSSAGEVEQAVYNRPQTLDSLMSALKASEDVTHDVTTFLGRPTKIGSGMFKSTDQPGVMLSSLQVEDAIFASAPFRMHREKLMGYYGMSATAVFKLVTNPQPFEAGLYQIFYVPLKEGADDLGNLWMLDDTSLANRTPLLINRLPFCTGMPNKIFNLDGASEVELRVPYIAPNAFFNLMETESLWGTFYVQCILPLSTSDNGSTCGFTMYLSFEDVQLYGAARPFETQGPEDLMSLPSVSELSERAEGLTNGSTKISDVANTISSIPFLPAVAPEVTMTAKAVGAIASQFGFSKPNADPNITRMAVTPYGQPQNVDSTSNAFKLGTSEVQNSQIIPMGPTEEDEMSFLSLMQKPQFHGTVGWSTTDTAGKMLKYWPVNPNCELGGDGLFFPSRMYYLATMFRYWRGTIRYTFHVAATKFHSGRIRLVYDLDSQKTPNTNDVGYNFSRVIDIRGGMTFTVECPYFATTLFRNVPHLSNDQISSNWFITERDQVMQTFTENALYMFVESDLRAAPNVAQNIAIAVFISAGNDFEFACPHEPGFGFINGPLYPASSSEQEAPKAANLLTQNYGGMESPFSDNEDWTSPTKTSKKRTEDKAAKRAMKVARKLLHVKDSQAPDVAATEDMVLSMCGDVLPPRVNDMQASEIAIGEKVVSLRELVKKYMLTGWHFKTGRDSETYILYPFMTPFSGTYTLDGKEVAQWSANYIARAKALFRFYKGGMRYLVRSAVASPLEVCFDVQPRLNELATGAYPFTFGTASQMTFAMSPGDAVFTSTVTYTMSLASFLPVESHLQGGAEFQVPYYSKYPFSVSRNNTQDLQGKAFHDLYLDGTGTGDHPTGIVYVGLDTVENTLVRLYQSAADDFQLGFMLGAPAIQVTPTYGT